MPAKMSWNPEEIRPLYFNNATWIDMATKAGVTVSAVQKYAKRNWPERQCDIAAKRLRQEQQAANRNKLAVNRGKTTLPTLNSLAG